MAENTTRQNALKWWNLLEGTTRAEIINIFKKFITGMPREHTSLTGREIEMLYNSVCPVWTTEWWWNDQGYEKVSDNGVYAHYINKAGTKCKGYGPMGKGKRIVKFNRLYDLRQDIFVYIREDADTRTVFHGVVENSSEMSLILKAVR